MIWNAGRATNRFEPGANYALSGELFAGALELRALELSEADPGSVPARELWRRERFVADICDRKQEALELPYWTWWGEARTAGAGDAAVSGDGGSLVRNATGLLVGNVSSGTWEVR